MLCFFKVSHQTDKREFIRVQSKIIESIFTAIFSIVPPASLGDRKCYKEGIKVNYVILFAWVQFI